jgi:glycerol kinase
MADYILAIDQGTTGTTVALMKSDGSLCASVNNEFEQHYPHPGWVSHRPEDIWQSVVKGLRGVLRRAGCKGSDIAAIGITNQRETALIWDAHSGDALNDAVVWQCRRTTEFCESLKAAGHEKLVQGKAGLVLDPYFSASKFRWLLRNTPRLGPALRAGRVRAGTVDSFLVWRLSGGENHVTDVSNAARTSLMNLKNLSWDSRLLDLFEVPADILPSIRPCAGELGRTRGVPGLPDGIPITGSAGDQQAALFGQACFGVGDAKCTFGTGSFIVMNTGDERLQSHSGLLTTVAWQLGEGGEPVYALEGGAFICGAAVQFLRDGLKLIRRSSDVEALALEVEDHGGVEFVPALTGLGAPHWAPDARGLICGLTRGSQRGHIARATLDAMALQNADILLAMEKDLGRRMRPLRVDGGASANNLLMQIQADVLGRKLIRPRVIETTVAGACYLAGIGAGIWRGTADIRRIWQAGEEFRVKLSAPARRRRQDSWRTAVERTLA